MQVGKDTKLLYKILSYRKSDFFLETTHRIKIGNIKNFNFDSLDDLSKTKIEDLNYKIAKLGMTIKNIKVPEFKEINDLVSAHGSLVNYEA